MGYFEIITQVASSCPLTSSVDALPVFFISWLLPVDPAGRGELPHKMSTTLTHSQEPLA